MELDVATLNRDVERETLTLKRVEAELRRVIVGQDYLLDRLLVGLLARGHVLIEGVPGPRQDPGRQDAGPDAGDRLPAHPVHPRPAAGRPRRHADLRPAQRRVPGPQGAGVHPPAARRRDQPRARQGAVGACSSRWRSGRSRSATGRYPLPEPFMVLATQNPIEQEGTYPLAEAQVDRFMMKLKVDYPTRAEEARSSTACWSTRDLKAPPGAGARAPARPARGGATRSTSTPRSAATSSTSCSPPATRAAAGLPDLADLISFGASPRATLFLARAAKAHGAGARPRLRDPRGRQGARARRAAPPHRPHLRGRGRGDHDRRAGRAAARPHPGPLSRGAPMLGSLRRASLRRGPPAAARSGRRAPPCRRT